MTSMLIGAMIMSAVELPMGPAPAPVAAPHFHDRLHAYVWRNWQIVPTERLAEVVGAKSDDIVRMGTAMGLCAPPTITHDQFRRSTTTIIKHNWHLLPYEQLLQLYFGSYHSTNSHPPRKEILLESLLFVRTCYGGTWILTFAQFVYVYPVEHVFPSIHPLNV